MINYIAKKFDEHITTLFSIKPEVYKFISTHERKHICIENLAKELGKIENYKVKIDLIKLDRLIKDFAEMFAKVALGVKEAELRTQAERVKLEAEADRLKEYLKEFEEGDDARLDELNSIIK